MLPPRERVLCALEHEEPDRVPIFFGTSGATTMLVPAYKRLKEHLRFESQDRSFSEILQYALIDEEILLRMGSDGRPLTPGPAPSSLRKEAQDGSLVDEWGIVWDKRPGSLYYEIVQAPLRRANDDDVASWPWPDLAHPSRFQGLADRARNIQERGYAVVAISGVNPWETYCTLRGMDQALVDLLLDEDFVHALFGKLTDLMLAGAVGLVQHAGEQIDVLVMSDDLGTESAPMMSPETYRKLLKPYHARIISAIRAHTEAKIFFHSDGNIYPLIGDLVEIGVDILNPIQVSASGMGDTARLKREFGDRLSFCGAVDTQWALPYGSPSDVRSEVRRRIRDLAPKGGYLLSAVHCLQPDVPPENVLAMCDEARRAGQYPLSL